MLYSNNYIFTLLVNLEIDWVEPRFLCGET